jgi:hypothetical protein
MDLEQFLIRSDSFSGAFNSRYCNQDLLEQARELACRGLKLFPVSLASKLNGCPDKLIYEATSDISLLEELSAVAAQPLSGLSVALGPSGLCVLVLDGAVGRASFAALVPDLEECVTLQARRGDKTYAFFLKPAGMRIASRKLAPGVSILGDCAGFDVPPTGGAAWINPGADIEALPNALRELLAPNSPDNLPGRAMPVPKPSSSRPAPCRFTEHFPQPDKAPRQGHPVCGRADWRGGYRISRRR